MRALDARRSGEIGAAVAPRLNALRNRAYTLGFNAAERSRAIEVLQLYF